MLIWACLIKPIGVVMGEFGGFVETTLVIFFQGFEVGAVVQVLEAGDWVEGRRMGSRER